MAFPMPVVIPLKDTNTLGGEGTRRNFSLAFDVKKQTAADLHSMLVGIAKEDTAEQVQAGNPPQLVQVDNKNNQPVEEAKQKIVVLFGTVLAREAMRMVEIELASAIAKSTRVHTGRLSSSGSWQWRYVKRGSSTTVVTAANPPTSFGPGDRLVLLPVSVPYATAVNRAVANSGRLNAHTSPERKRRDGTTRLPPKNSQNLGFLGATARAVRKRADFKQFGVIVEFSKTHAVAGEMYSHGTGMIVIKPRLRQV